MWGWVRGFIGLHPLWCLYLRCVNGVPDGKTRDFNLRFRFRFHGLVALVFTLGLDSGFFLRIRRCYGMRTVTGRPAMSILKTSEFFQSSARVPTCVLVTTEPGRM